MQLEASYKGDPVSVRVLTKEQIEGPDGSILTSTAYFDEDDVLHIPEVDTFPEYKGRAKGRPRFRPEQLEKWAEERSQVRGVVRCI